VWDAEAARPSVDHLDALCHDVHAALESAIRAELDARETVPVWQQEDHDHEEFGRDRLATFVGRDDVLAQLGYFLPGRPPRPCW
jgi:hypothetical protein